LNFVPECTSRLTSKPEQCVLGRAWHLGHLVTESLAVAPVCGPRLFEHLKTKRLTKRVVQKPDGRYLIYYEPGARKAH
jgi:hypothetical protein